MFRIAAVLIASIVLATGVQAQHPLAHYTDAVEARFTRSQPVVSYVLRVDTADLSGFTVEMRLRHVPDTFRLGMVAHPEYDDRYWRYVEDLRVEAPAGAASVVRQDSALWRVTAVGGEVVVRYRLGLPTEGDSFRSAWRPFLSPTGGLVGGPHSFMYVVGATLAPSHVLLELPAGWDVATGLEPTSEPHTFFAPSVDVLVDSPMLVGQFRSWRFAVDGVPHRVAYWPRPDATPFDSTAFVDGLERLVRQAVKLFGRAPYREYDFLFMDGAYGALEHWNSVTIGAPSADLADDPAETFQEAAHEYFHAWNLMRIHPAEYRGVDYRPPQPTRGLWFSEGLSILYSDLLRRRAGLPVGDSTRVGHLEGMIARYLSNPGNARISPERVSLVEYGAEPGALGDYALSVHLLGEVLGNMIDLIVRDATDGRRSVDDVMRAMLDRFSGERGFTGRDIDQTVAEVCGCQVRAFFEAYVRGATPIDFNRYLGTIGLRAQVTWHGVTQQDGTPAPDLRIYAWLPETDSLLHFLLSAPTGLWGRAGLHTGDRILAVNGVPMRTITELRGLLRRLRLGDTVIVDVVRPAGPWRTTVVIAGFERPSVHIEEIPGATERQRRLREAWGRGEP